MSNEDFWDEYAPTAALGALFLIAAPMIIVALPLWLLGRLAIVLLDRFASDRAA